MIECPESGGSDGGNGNNSYDGDNPSNPGSNMSFWDFTNRKVYEVTNGVVGNIYRDENYTWISRIDNEHYEFQINSTQLLNEILVNSEIYTRSRVGSIQNTVNDSRSGNTINFISHTISDYTYTIDYVDPSYEDSVITYYSVITQTTTSVLDEETGLTLSQTIETTGTQNGIPIINSYSEIYYTHELLDTAADGVKTYKSYVIGSEQSFLQPTELLMKLTRLHRKITVTKPAKWYMIRQRN